MGGMSGEVGGGWPKSARGDTLSMKSFEPPPNAKVSSGVQMGANIQPACRCLRACVCWHAAGKIMVCRLHFSVYAYLFVACKVVSASYVVFACADVSLCV